MMPSRERADCREMEGETESKRAVEWRTDNNEGSHH